MRSSDFPYLADWFAITLRWLSLLGIAAGLGMNGALGQVSSALLLGSALWNMLITILATLNRRLLLHRPFNLLADIIFTLGLFHLNGGVLGPIPWSGILPIFAASIYYGAKGGLSCGLLVSLLQIGLTYLYGGRLVGLPALGILAGFNLVLGLVMGTFSNRLMNQIRLIYQNQLRARKETEMRLLKAERNRVQTFMSMIETLSSTLDYHLVLNTVLDLCANAIGGPEKGADEMISAVLLFNDHDLRVEAARHLAPSDLKQTFPAESGVLHDALQAAEMRSIENPACDPELSRIVLLETCKVALTLPLIRGMSAYGMMIFAHPDPAFFAPERVELLEMIGHQAVITIQNARLYQDLEEEKERIVMTQEEARKKLARDLHDGPIQSVAAIAMRVDVARHLMTRSIKDAVNELVKIEDLARRTTKELRHMLFTLRPLALETEGLVIALQTMAEKNRETYQQNVKLAIEQQAVDKLELGKQTVIFYLAEEAVTNARKHAQATVILVRLRDIPQDPGIVLLEIIDNGLGFDVQEVLGSYDQRGSLGMVNLRERTDLVNGLLHIDSTPGKGTRIQVFIPVDEGAADRLQRGKLAQPA